MAGAERLLEPIRAVHRRIRSAVVDACARQAAEQLAAVAADAAPVTGGDTIYAIDRVGEGALVPGLAELAREEPLCLVAEGLPDNALVLPRDAREEDCRWRLLVDPIDGTRGLMYQKRSAWILTGVAPNRGPGTRLRDIVLAVQTEIPLVKQHLADQLWAIRGQGMEARRFDRLSGAEVRLSLRPSRADTIAHGFASIARFFPGARDVLAAIDDEVVQALVPAAPGRAACFEDQYAATGGQLYELIAGHDRFVADLRPLVQSVRAAGGSPPGLCCHPYDLCTALIAQESGVIVTDPTGAPIDAPFDVAADVAWAGYANERLRALVEPVLQAALRRHGLLPASSL
ncbi:MAG: inositol monophosphatase [Gemmatimonadetes bacterium]|nr:inositol monophosphatase [Gemmatimonadota bacterium]